MCQVEEDYHEPIRNVPRAPAIVCVKCKDARAAVAVRAGDAFCRLCFKEYFTHKFRAMLGKTRLVFPGEKVLLAVSGGASSSAMLALVQEGLSQNAHKKLRFSPGIVHIDEGGAVGLSTEQRQQTVAALQAVFQATGFPFLILPLEQVLDLPSSVLAAAAPPPHRPSAAYKAAVHQFAESGERAPMAEGTKSPTAPVEESQTHALRHLLGSAETLTAREELLRTLRHHLLLHAARRHGYSKLMMGDSCSRLAVKLLTSISLGRGAQVAQDTGFSDSRCGDVTSVRPMRDYTAKEIAFYNHVFDVPSVVTPGLDTKATDKVSIHRLTEAFVTNLQQRFPSTVSTIYRTSEKLQTTQVKPSCDEERDTCLLCLCTMDTSTGSASAFAATLVSEELSVLKLHQAENQSAERSCSSTECVNTRGSCCSSSAQLPAADRLKDLLCYSCQRTVRDLTSVSVLPPYVLSEARFRSARSDLRREIRDFLLHDDEP